MLAEKARVHSEIKDDDDGEEFTCLCCEGELQDLPDSFGKVQDFLASVASLNVQDYLQRDADSLFESTFLSLQSDTVRDPRSPGYDITLPPANHRKAMMRTDADE